MQKIYKNTLIILVGATASGKTDMAIELAKRHNAEIISADSMQVYKHMDIGTAKPILKQRCNIPHYLMDVVTPSQQFSVSDYVQMADDAIKTITDSNKNVIVVGGTGFYIQSLLYPVEFKTDSKVRESLNAFLRQNGANVLHDRLKEVDALSAQKIHPNNTRRVLRALEIYLTEGKQKSSGQRLLRESRYDFVLYQLTKPRELLYEHINKRVDIMMQDGLLDEVKGLIGSLGQTASQAIGYKELIEYLDGQSTLENAVELIKQRTRNYAKRQLTYFKRMNTCELDMSKGNETVLQQILDDYSIKTSNL